MMGANTSSTSPVAMETMYSDIEHVFMAGTLVMIMMLSLVGNIMVCVTVYRKRRLRTRTNAFIINLTFADLGVVTLCMPFSLITCLSHHWTLGDVICSFNGVVNIVFTQTSLLTLMAIAIDKYYAIVWPLKRIMTKQRTAGLIAWTWTQPIIIAVVPFTGIIHYQFKPGTTQCGLEFPTTLYEIIYGVSVSIIGYFVPLGIMGYVYSNIFHSAKRSARRISRVSLTSTTSVNSFTAHRKVAVTVLILVVLFLGCWTPYFTYVLLLIAYPSVTPDPHVMSLGKASYWMAFLCSALNPYIYGARNPQFRKEFKILFCCFYPCFTHHLKIRGCSAISDSRESRESTNEYSPRRRDGAPWGTPVGSPAAYPKAESSTYLITYLRNLAVKNNTLNDSGFGDSNHDNSLDKQSNQEYERTRRKSSLKLRFQENFSFIDSPRNSCHEECECEYRYLESDDEQSYVGGQILSFCNDITDRSQISTTATEQLLDANGKNLEMKLGHRCKRRWIESSL